MSLNLRGGSQRINLSPLSLRSFPDYVWEIPLFRIELIGFDFFGAEQFNFNIMSLINQLTAQQLREAADLKDNIADLQKQLEQLVGAHEVNAVSALVKTAKPSRRKMSAGGIAKIRAAQKARWAKIKASKIGQSLAEKPAKKKRVVSAAVKAKMAAAAKARWSKVKAAKK
jgi:hypothetical protein